MSQNQRPALQESICLRAEIVHLREVADGMVTAGLEQEKGVAVQALGARPAALVAPATHSGVHSLCFEMCC